MKAKLIFNKRAGVFMIRWHDGEGYRERSTKTRIRRDAERFLAKLEAEGKLEPKSKDWTWEHLCEAFMEHHFPLVDPRTQTSYVTAMNAFTAFAKPDKLLAHISAATLQDFKSHSLKRTKMSTAKKQTDKPQKKLSKATAASYLRHVRSMLSFAMERGMIAAVPVMRRAPKGESGSKMKGFALTREEFREWLRSEPDQLVRHALILLWTSGLRLGEAVQLEWRNGKNRVDMKARPYPMLVLGDQKNGESLSVEMPPLMARWLRRFKEREGRIMGGSTRSDVWSKWIIESGKRSPVRRQGMSPGAHDMRRSFGTLWSQVLMPQDLQQLMRHADISTTMLYYVDRATSGLANKMYKK